MKEKFYDKRMSTPTPSCKDMILLLGGMMYEGVSITIDQFKNLQNYYEREDSDNILLQAGREVTTFREAARDGLRLMAILSYYLEEDEDPVRLLINMIIHYGLAPKAEWVSWLEEEE